MISVTVVAEIHGRCDSRFAGVAETLSGSLDAVDVGAAAAVYVGGEPVVDIWGGYADAERSTAWERDTIVNVWSTTKPMVALCALILADRGELDLDAPVARYWPEFAAEGKQDVLVRHLLGHTAGLPEWDGPITTAELYRWDEATSRLAGQRPRWTPGSAGGYHSMTYGYLIGEVIARVSGRSVGRFFADEVAGPLGADFHIGLPADQDHRVAALVADPGGDRPEGFLVGVGDANSAPWRRAEIPAVNGHGNARSVAAVQSVLTAGGTVNGVRLLSSDGCERVFEEQFRGVDRVLEHQITWGLGYRLEGRTCSWGGWGGSIILNDFDHRMTVAYVMNQVLWRDDYARGLAVVMSAYEAITA